MHFVPKSVYCNHASDTTYHTEHDTHMSVRVMIPCKSAIESLYLSYVLLLQWENYNYKKNSKTMVCVNIVILQIKQEQMVYWLCESQTVIIMDVLHTMYTILIEIWLSIYDNTRWHDEDLMHLIVIYTKKYMGKINK